MTVHARQLARLCRERMAARDEQSLIVRQPEQQQATTKVRTSESNPMSRETLRL
jgi:hypothetical protein